MQLQLDERTEPDAIDESVTYPCLFDCSRDWSGSPNTLMVRITQTSSTILIAMLRTHWWGLCSLFLFYGLNKAWGVWRTGVQRALVDTYTWLAGSFFVFASISGYQNVGAATTMQYWSPAS